MFSYITIAKETTMIDLSLSDSYEIKSTKKWNVEIIKSLPLRFINVYVTPKKDENFNLMLYFKCDTPDLAKFNTPEKMEKSIILSSSKYLPDITEKKISLKKLME
jgi:hypothetical protein